MSPRSPSPATGTFRLLPAAAETRPPWPADPAAAAEPSNLQHKHSDTAQGRTIHTQYTKTNLTRLGFFFCIKILYLFFTIISQHDIAEQHGRRDTHSLQCQWYDGTAGTYEVRKGEGADHVPPVGLYRMKTIYKHIEH